MLAPVVSFAVDRYGFPRVLEAVAPLQLARSGAGAPEIDIPAGARLIRKAFRAAPTAGACLHHALVQYLLHLRVGPEPRLVVGVRRGTARLGTGWVPDAHAWVEDAGVPDGQADFSPLFALTPSRGLERFDEASV